MTEANRYVDLSNDEIRALNLDDSEEMLMILAEKDAMLNRRISYPSSYSVSVDWQQQIESYYCGPATASIILDCTSTPTTQEEIAGSKYLRTNSTTGTPWFSGAAGMETADPKYYNMMYALNQWQYDQLGRRDWQYAVYPYNQEQPTAAGYFDRIKSTTYMDYPVAIYVVSYSTNKFNENYPNNPSPIRHWVVCNGWTGNYIRICDPASGISGFTNVSKTYTVKYDKLTSTSWGIVY